VAWCIGQHWKNPESPGKKRTFRALILLSGIYWSFDPFVVSRDEMLVLPDCHKLKSVVMGTTP